MCVCMHVCVCVCVLPENDTHTHANEAGENEKDTHPVEHPARGNCSKCSLCVCVFQKKIVSEEAR